MMPPGDGEEGLPQLGNRLFPNFDGFAFLFALSISHFTLSMSFQERTEGIISNLLQFKELRFVWLSRPTAVSLRSAVPLRRTSRPKPPPSASPGASCCSSADAGTLSRLGAVFLSVPPRLCVKMSSPRKSWRRSFKVQHDSPFNRSSHVGICENAGVFDNRHLRPSRVGRASVSFNHHHQGAREKFFQVGGRALHASLT